MTCQYHEAVWLFYDLVEYGHDDEFLQELIEHVFIDDEDKVSEAVKDIRERLPY